MNGGFKTFEAGRFTYIADPLPAEAGLYKPASGGFYPAQDRFEYNAGQFVAIRGEGLCGLTRVYLNGKPVIDLTVVDSRTLCFRAPDNTIGPVTISVSNTADGSDTVYVTEKLSIGLDAGRRISKGAIRFARLADLLAVAGSDTISLYSTRDGISPVFLSEILVGATIKEMAISGGHMIVCAGDRNSLIVYDISNIYSPVKINALNNTSATAHTRLAMRRDLFVSLGADGLHMGSIHGAGWKTLQWTMLGIDSGSIADIALDDDYIYLLTPDRVEARSFNDWNTVAAAAEHDIDTPAAIKQGSQRLLVLGGNRLSFLNTGRIDAEGRIDRQGPVRVDGMVEAAACGELVAIVRDVTGQRCLFLYDINLDGPDGVALNEIAEVFSSDGFGGAVTLEFTGDLLEWGIPLAQGGNYWPYYNVKIPLANTVGIIPERYFFSADDTVAIGVTGDPSAWRNVSLSVLTPAGAPVSGDTILSGDRLEFRVIGDAYQADAPYDLSLFNTPAEVIQGGELTYDLSWVITGAPIFGIRPPEIRFVSPSNIIAGQPVILTVHGTGFDTASRILLNSDELPESAWTCNDDGTRLNIDVRIDTPGFYTLCIAPENGAAAFMPGAIQVTAPLAITDILTDSTQGPGYASNSGGTRITVTGTGFDAGVELFWFESGKGILPGPSNRIRIDSTETGIIFDSPACLHGRDYNIVVKNPVTGEEVWADQSISGYDDTRPKLMEAVLLSYASACRLVFNEQVAATGFSVMCKYRDYSGRPDEDVSNQFEMETTGDRVTIRLKTGYSLSHNRIYTLSIQGIADGHGNAPLNAAGISAGTYQSVFTAEDTLAPRDLQLYRTPDNTPVTLAMALIRGKTYRLVPGASDNMAASNELRFDIRISTDGGIAYGPWQKITGAGFDITLGESDKGVSVLLKATDKQGVFAEKRFDAGIADANIHIGPIYTAPSPVEELSRADINFDITGDVDLITSATMEILGKTYPVALTGTGASRKAAFSYFTPALSQIKTDSIGVCLRLLHGINGKTEVCDAYTVVRDNAAPTVQIVSPPDGSRIPDNESCEVLIRSFDRYGIASVEASMNNSPWQDLPDPGRFVFTPESHDPVHVSVRATDPNGNISDISSVALTPYTPSAQGVQIDILTPEDGAKFHEGQTIAVEVLMRNLNSAELHLDVGGLENDSRNPQPIPVTRNDVDPERVAINLVLPRVNESIVGVLRLTSGALTVRRYINLIPDRVIDGELNLVINPAETVLTGAQLWIESTVPQEMADFNSQSSQIRIEDPEGTLTTQIPLDAGPHPVNISGTGTRVKVEGILADLSGNEARQVRFLNKAAYFGDNRTILYTSTMGETIGDLDALPKGEPIWSVNERNGGYKIHNSLGVIASGTEGAVSKLQFTGSGIVAQELVNGETRLVYWPLSGSAFAGCVKQTILGELTGGSGNILFTRHGELFDAVVHVGGEFIQVAGQSITEPVLMARVDSGRLFVLSENGLYGFIPGGADDLRLQRLFFTAVAGMEGFRIAGDRVVTWKENKADVYQLMNNGALAGAGSLDVKGKIREVVFDGELTWILSDGPYAENTWQGFMEGNCVAVLTNGADRLVFANAAVFMQVTGEAGDEIIRQSLIPQYQAGALSPTITERPTGILIGDIAESITFGGQMVAFFDANGGMLPAHPIWENGGYAWFIPRSELEAGDIEVVRTDRSGNEESITLDWDETSSTLIGGTRPNAGTGMAMGGRVPAVVAFAESARIMDIALAWNGAGCPAAIIQPGDRVYQWLHVPETGDSAPFEINASGEDSIAVQLTDNAGDLESVSIISPQAGRSFTEGETATIEYRASQSGGEIFKHAEIRLTDFNKKLIDRRLVAGPRGRATIRMPGIDAQETYSIVVRAYYGDSYHYCDSEIPVLVSPRYRTPEITLAGVRQRIMPGSQLHIDLSTNIEGVSWTGGLAVYDENETLLSAGRSEVTLDVPDNVSRLRIVAEISDGLGNTETRTETIEVVAPFSIEISGGRPFAAARADAGDAWFAQGRGIYGIENDQPKVLLEAPVTALAYSGNKLIASVSGSGLLLLDPDDSFRVLSRFPVSGHIDLLEVSGDCLLAVVDGKLDGYRISGNALEFASHIAVSGTIRQVGPRGDGFDIITDNGLTVIGARFETVRRIDGNFTALAESIDAKFAVTATGGLSVIRNDRIIRTLPMEQPANRIVMLQGYLLALTGDKAGDKGWIQVIDIRNPELPALIGVYRFTLGTDVSGALLTGGRIWMGGSDGRIATLSRSSHEPVSIFSPDRPRGFIHDIAMKEGTCMAAAGDFGLARLTRGENGAWTETVYPAPYSYAAREVEAANGKTYLLQPSVNRVISLDASDVQKTVISGEPFSVLAVTPKMVVSAAGSRIYAAPVNGAGTGSYDILEPVEAIAAAGEHILVSTVEKHLYRVDLGSFPINDWTVQETLILTTTEPIRIMASDGDNLFHADGNQLHRVRIADPAQDVSIGLGENIRTISLWSGNLWAAAGNSVYCMSTGGDWSAAPPPILTAENAVTALGVEYDRIFVGQGEYGISAYRLPTNGLTASPVLYEPSADALFTHDLPLVLKLEDIAGINAVRYSVNGNAVGRSDAAPFALQMRLPANLANGQPFEISASIETVWGDVRHSAGRRAWLRGENIPSNPLLSVILDVSGDFAPSPVVLTATVQGSIQPVARVEFYHASSSEGPFALIGKCYGPEYRIYKDLGTDADGSVVKARVIDIYGNAAESLSQPVTRMLDNEAPIEPMFRLEGQLKNGMPLAGQPFTLVADLYDSQSGVERGILYRNNVIVAIETSTGNLRYEASTPVEGETISYRLCIFDRAGNMRDTSVAYTAVGDGPPEILNLVVDSPIREKSQFKAYLTARDDAGLKQIRIVWNDIPKVIDLTGQLRVDNYPVTLKDDRNVRIGSALNQTFTAFAIDGIGQETSCTRQILVQPDIPPDAGKIVIKKPATGYFGSLIPIRIEQIAAADDGGYTGITTRVIDVTSQPPVEVLRADGQSIVVTSLRAPGTAADGAEMRFVVKLADALGQESESAVQTVSLSSMPNDIRFVSDNPDINPQVAQTGAIVPLQVRVSDAAAVPLPGFEIKWYVRNGASYTALGTSTTDAQGNATFNFNTLLSTVSDCVVMASVSGFSAISATHAITLLPGPPDHVEFEYIPSVGAGQIFHIRFRAVDIMGNLVPTVSEETVAVRMPPGFHIGFSGDITIGTVDDGSGNMVEQASATLRNGQGDLAVSAVNILGQYSAMVSFGPSSLLYSSYDHDGDASTKQIKTGEIRFNVTAGPPAGLRMSVISTTNDTLGDLDRLETGETASIGLDVVDAFGNKVTVVREGGSQRDANYTVDVGIGGNAVSGGTANLIHPPVIRGSGKFPVTDQTAEIVQLSVRGISPVTEGLNPAATLTVEFLKKRPAVYEATFRSVHNGTIPVIDLIYTEPVANGGAGAPVSITLEGTPVTGETTIDGNRIVFTPDQPVVLNKPYVFDTHASTWVGAAAQDPVLTQQGQIQSPHAVIATTPESYFLEGKPQELGVEFGAGIAPTALKNGKIHLGDRVTSFDFTSKSFTMPAYSGIGLADGALVTLSLVGTINNSPLRIANTISIRVLLENGDYDGDGLSNALELILNLDPTKKDTDGDGTEDGQEDSDGDGLSNASELFDGTDPNNSDIDPPGILSVTPVDGAVDVALVPVITVVFNEPIKVSTVGTETFTVTGEGIPVTGRYAFENENRTVTWKSEEALAPNGVYQVSLSSGIRDMAGNRLNQQVSTFQVTDFRIVLPQAGDTAIEGTSLQIKAEANNPAGINRVDFYVDDVYAGSAEAIPFDTTYTVPPLASMDDGSLEIRAVGIIGGKNRAIAATLDAAPRTYQYAFTPRRAVDSNSNPDFNQGSVSVVMDDIHAWMDADLGAVERIESIRIHLLEGCCRENNRLAVLVADRPFETSDFASPMLPEVYANGAEVIYQTTAAYDTGIISINGPFTGRYIRLVHPTGEFLAISELEINEQTLTVDVPGIQVEVAPVSP